MKVAVIGAGISGLVTAYRLQQQGVDVTVFEASDKPGGNIQSERRDGFLLEYGPNTFLANRNLYELIQDLGLSGEIVAPRPSAKKRYIVRYGRLVQLPSRVVDLFSTEAFSTSGKLQLLGEPFRRSVQADGETVYDFFARRFGTEIADFAADPFIAGIYAGDPRKLSIEMAFPRLHEYEKKHGSVIRGAVFSKKEKSTRLPKGFPRSFTFTDGVSTLTRALSEKLRDQLSLRTRVLSVDSAWNDYRVDTESGSHSFDAVVISTTASSASRLIADAFDSAVAEPLTNINYPPIAVVITGFEASQLRDAPSGFGMLVPAVEKRQILGVLFNSSAFGNRAPEGYHLYTTFIGGSRNPELCEKPEDGLVSIAMRELDDLFGVDGEPVLATVKKWDRAIPQYNVGYEKVHAAIDEVRYALPGVFFCSNFYKGISVGDCVKNADLTADEVIRFLHR